MIDWVLAQGDERRLMREAAARVLVGGQLSLWAIPIAGRVLTVAALDAAGVRRRATWPELLVDWSEINEEPPYPGEAAPALAEALSALGVPAFAVAYDGARASAAAGWYERGALISLEHVGRATDAWSPQGGLGRPRMAGLAGGVADVARSLGADATILDRIETQHAAGARAIVERVLVRLVDRPPPIDDLAGLVALAPSEKLRL